MIVEICKNKYSNCKHNKEILNSYRDLFLNNKEKWLTGPQIENILGKTGRRKYINLLRCEGLPIISGIKGYKYTNNERELRQCYDELRNRALRAITAAKLMKKII